MPKTTNTLYKDLIQAMSMGVPAQLLVLLFSITNKLRPWKQLEVNPVNYQEIQSEWDDAWERLK